jgi:hypothetical protein
MSQRDGVSQWHGARKDIGFRMIQNARDLRRLGTLGSGRLQDDRDCCQVASVRCNQKKALRKQYFDMAEEGLCLRAYALKMH